MHALRKWLAFGEHPRTVQSGCKIWKSGSFTSRGHCKNNQHHNDVITYFYYYESPLMQQNAKGYITAGEKKTMRCRAWGAGGGKVQIAAHLWLGHTGREQRFRYGQSGTRRCAFVNKCLGEMNLWPRRESWFEVWAGS